MKRIRNARRIVRLHRHDGVVIPETIYVTRRSKRKRSRGLRGIEKLVHDFTDASAAFSGNYLRRHRRANRKKRDGWLRDLDRNLVLAARRGRRRLPRYLRLRTV